MTWAGDASRVCSLDSQLSQRALGVHVALTRRVAHRMLREDGSNGTRRASNSSASHMPSSRWTCTDTSHVGHVHVTVRMRLTQCVSELHGGAGMLLSRCCGVAGVLDGSIL